MPLRVEGASAEKSLWYGLPSAIVEPVAAVIGAGIVTTTVPVLPYALSLAAGAMMYIVMEEIIPESHAVGNVDLATDSFLGGLAVMMLLDVSPG